MNSFDVPEAYPVFPNFSSRGCFFSAGATYHLKSVPRLFVCLVVRAPLLTCNAEGARCSHFARLQGPVHKCPVLSGVPTRARRRHVRQKGREKNMVATYAHRFCFFFCWAQGWTQNLEFDIFKAVLARCGTSGVTVQRLRLALLLKGQGSSPAVGFFYLFC